MPDSGDDPPELTDRNDRNVELYPQFFLELITTQLRFYMVSPQLSLLIILTMQSYKFYQSSSSNEIYKTAPSMTAQIYFIVTMPYQMTLAFCFRRIRFAHIKFLLNTRCKSLSS